MSDDLGSIREAIRIRNIESVIGAEVAGVDLSQGLSDADFASLRNALHRHSLLLIRGQSFTPPTLAEFVRRFGPLQRFRLLQPRSKEHAERYLCEDEPDVMRVGNVEVNGRPKAMFTNASPDWHIDDLYKANPLQAIALFAIEAPRSGGDTLFAGLQAAYAALDRAMQQKIETLQCVYTVQRLDALHRRRDADRPPLSDETIAANPPVSHPLVRIQPVTGRKGLLFAPEMFPQVQGLSEEDSRPLIACLADHATSERFQYRHKWRNGDLLIWDNLSTLHRATEFDSDHDERLLYRAMISRISCGPCPPSGL